MGKIGSLILSYGTTDYLKPCIKQYLWTDKVLVMNYLFPQSKPFPDDTPEICKELGIECESGSGFNQEHILNIGLDKFKDFEAVFIVDNDEFIMHDDQLKIIDILRKGNHSHILCKIRDYAKDLYYKYEDRGYEPIVLARPSVRFYTVRCASGGYPVNDVTVHHMGFIFSDEKVLWKQDKQLKTNGGQFGNLLCRAKFAVTPPQELLDILQK